MAGPAIVATRSSSSTDWGGSLDSESIPSGVTKEHTLFAFVSMPNGDVTDINPYHSTADQWELVGRSAVASSCPRGALFMRRPNGVTPNSSYTWYKDYDQYSIVTYFAARDVDLANPIAVVPSWLTDTGNVDTAAAPSITTPVNDCLLVNLWACTPYQSGSTDDVYSTTVSGADGTHRSFGTDYQAHLVAWDLIPTAGATGTRTATFLDTSTASGPAQVYGSLALRPLAGTGEPQFLELGVVIEANRANPVQPIVAGQQPVVLPIPITRAEREEMFEADQLDVWLDRMEVLDAQDQVVGDITRDVEECVIRHDGFADMHGSIEIVTTADLAWGRDRIRPYLYIAGNGWIDRVARGVFIPTAPRHNRDMRPRQRTVSGFDKLYLLNQRLPSTVSYPAGTPILHAAREQLRAAGVHEDLIDNSRGDAVLTEPRNWPVTEDMTRLNVVNALLEMLGYRGLRMDLMGRAESGPYVPPNERPVVWRYDTGSGQSNVFAGDAELEDDHTNAFNRWVFWSNVEREDPPVNRDGLFVYDNVAEGPSSQSALHPIVRTRAEAIEAVDQAALELNGMRIVQQDIRAERRVKFATDVNPYFEHQDVFEYIDRELGTAGKMEHISYEIRVHDGGGVMTHDARAVIGGVSA